MPTAPPDPAVTLRRAVSSLRTIGTAFILVGGALSLLAVAFAGPRSVGLVVSGSAALFMVGPGVLYHVTAALIRRNDVAIAHVSRRIAVGQSVLAAAAVALAVGGSRTRSLRLPAELGPAIVPAAVMLFFVPALLALAYTISRALSALRLTSEARRGFEVMAVAEATPVDDVATPVVPAGPPAAADHPTVGVRETPR